MVRILGNTLKNKKRIDIALTQIYGVGRKTSLMILKVLNIDPSKKVIELTKEDIASIRDYLENSTLKFEGNLRRVLYTNIKRLIDIKSFRGRRLVKGLPVRGQRTRTNSRTTRRSNFILNSSK